MTLYHQKNATRTCYKGKKFLRLHSGVYSANKVKHICGHIASIGPNNDDNCISQSHVQMTSNNWSLHLRGVLIKGSG